MTPFLSCNTHNKSGVHNKRACWGGKAIVTAGDEDKGVLVVLASVKWNLFLAGLSRFLGKIITVGQITKAPL